MSAPIDHFNASVHRTDSNRFRANSIFYKSQCPVILYDFGEAGGTTGQTEIWLQEVNGSRSSVMEIARRFNGLLVRWDPWRLRCSEIGLFRFSDPSNPDNKISSSLSVAGMQQHSCKTFFKFPELPSSPNISTVQNCGGWNVKPSNEYLGQSEIDPNPAYIRLARAREPQRPLTTVVPKCNIPPPGDVVFGFVYEGASHATDLYAIRGTRGRVAVRAVETGIERFSSVLEKWLPCFGT